MTENMSKAYYFIVKFWQENGFSPTYNEVARALSCSYSYAYNLVQNLQTRGHVMIQSGHRAIIPKELEGKLND